MTKKQLISILAPATWSASIIPIIIGALYSLYTTGLFRLDIFIALVIATVGSQCFANIVNDYSDFKSGLDNSNSIFGPEGSIIVSDGVPPFEIKNLAKIVLIFLTIPVGYLTYFIGPSILIVGSLGLIVAFLYSAGPFPLSTSPFGELCSGLVMGFLITGISYYSFAGSIGWELILISIPVVFFITTMTFTNSICDMERDKGFRTTLALYLGKTKSLYLLKCFYIGIYLFTLMGILGKFLPLSLGIALLTFPIIWKRLSKINADNTTIQNKYPIMGLSCGSGMIFFKTYILVMIGEIIWKGMTL